MAWPWAGPRRRVRRISRSSVPCSSSIRSLSVVRSSRVDILGGRYPRSPRMSRRVGAVRLTGVGDRPATTRRGSQQLPCGRGGVALGSRTHEQAGGVLPMMNRKRGLTGVVSLAGAALASSVLLAMSGSSAKSQPKANWLTDGGDPQRTSWQRNESLISPATAKNMKLVWKLHLDNESRQLHNLFPPLIVSDVHTPQGPRQIGVVAGVSDNIYGIDLDSGKQLWKRHFRSEEHTSEL